MQVDSRDADRTPTPSNSKDGSKNKVEKSNRPKIPIDGHCVLSDRNFATESARGAYVPCPSFVLDTLRDKYVFHTGEGEGNAGKEGDEIDQLCPSILFPSV